MSETREIELTQGRVAIVDADAPRWVFERKWHAAQRATRWSTKWYAARNEGGRKNRRGLLLHRVIAGAEQGQVVDHINGDGLDNRRGNLRVCTDRQNTKSTRKRMATTSRFMGVFMAKGDTKWRAAIRVDYKSIHLGRFESETDAALAYDSAAREHHGDFATMNFPGPDERSALG